MFSLSYVKFIILEVTYFIFHFCVFKRSGTTPNQNVRVGTFLNKLKIITFEDNPNNPPKTRMSVMEKLMFRENIRNHLDLVKT